MYLSDKFTIRTFASDKELYDKLVIGCDHTVLAKQCKTIDEMKTILKCVLSFLLSAKHD